MPEHLKEKSKDVKRNFHMRGGLMSEKERKYYTREADKDDERAAQEAKEKQAKKNKKRRDEKKQKDIEAREANGESRASQACGYSLSQHEMKRWMEGYLTKVNPKAQAKPEMEGAVTANPPVSSQISEFRAHLDIDDDVEMSADANADDGGDAFPPVDSPHLPFVHDQMLYVFDSDSQVARDISRSPTPSHVNFAAPGSSTQVLEHASQSKRTPPSHADLAAPGSPTQVLEHASQSKRTPPSHADLAAPGSPTQVLEHASQSKRTPPSHVDLAAIGWSTQALEDAAHEEYD